MNIVIPMAGDGTRFEVAGYVDPKALIIVKKKPMIQVVVENLNIEGSYTFIIQKKHNKNDTLSTFLQTITKNVNIIEVEKLTEGPACTALLAEQYINSNTPLIITNCDQIIHDFNIDELIKFGDNTNADGILGAFISSSPKNSYMKLDLKGRVKEIKEKMVISNIATNGLHFWKHGSDFIWSAKKMIEENEKYNNEFYIAPTFNYLAKINKNVLPFFYNMHFPIGTPEDLNAYEQLYGNS